MTFSEMNFFHTSLIARLCDLEERKAELEEILKGAEQAQAHFKPPYGVAASAASFEPSQHLDVLSYSVNPRGRLELIRYLPD